MVVNYRSARLTLEALSHAAAANELSHEEIVVDNGSGDEDVELLRRERPDATVIELGENRGFAAANNAGIARARGRYLLLLNPDAFAQDGSITKLVAHAENHPQTGVVAPVLHNPDGSLQDSVFRRFPNLLTLFVDFCVPVAFAIRGTAIDPHNLPHRRLDRPRPIAHAAGAALLVRAETAQVVGPLDDGYFLYLEETDWERRIAAAGWRIDVVPQAVFVHLGAATASGSPLRWPAYLASVKRYYPRPKLAIAVLHLATVISLISLRVALKLRLGSPGLRDLQTMFRELRATLTQTGQR